MKKFEGFRSEASGGAYPMLPAGTYVAAVKNVKIDGQEPDQQLVLRLDIVEGDWAGYYTNRYNHDSKGGGQYEVRYKGDYRVQVPDPDNPKRSHPEWDVRTFNNVIWCFEQSNPGYKWDWKEQGLKGKVIGINVREGTFNGIPYTQIGRLEVADDVRQGLVKTMKPMEPRGSAPAPAIDTPSGMPIVETEELPF